MNPARNSDSPTDAFVHWCESCGREELLESQRAYEAGWDFPPNMGTWGVVSPRTCPNCTIKNTVWWAIAIEKRSIDEMTPRQRKAVGRILDELPPGTAASSNL
ncbi:hypothetical protein SAMN04489834_1692 [Microterricola viridarii]|uniref:Uncharacterized protein n=1 Tax=Microterricola viridarii TaxID=412690 RepID=A0A1H1T5D5_9MICO|nr:hypothetical protein SAMN04489834_1692 [Microterricola viridarii]